MSRHYDDRRSRGHDYNQHDCYDENYSQNRHDIYYDERYNHYSGYYGDYDRYHDGRYTNDRQYYDRNVDNGRYYGNRHQNERYRRRSSGEYYDNQHRNDEYYDDYEDETFADKVGAFFEGLQNLVKKKKEASERVHLPVQIMEFNDTTFVGSYHNLMNPEDDILIAEDKSDHKKKADVKNSADNTMCKDVMNSTSECSDNVELFDNVSPVIIDSVSASPVVEDNNTSQQ